MINLHESYVARLALELATPGSAVRYVAIYIGIKVLPKMRYTLSLSILSL